jgi:replicative DNA helicase
VCARYAHYFARLDGANGPEHLPPPGRRQGGAASPDDRVCEGGRNDYLFRRACRLRGDGLAAEEIAAALQAINTHRCVPPLPRAEVGVIARSAAGYVPNPGFSAGTPAPGTDPAARGQGVQLDFVDSRTFFSTEYRLDWLVSGVLVRGQAAVVGGPKKTLKTSVSVDLAVSLGTATPFLNRFTVPRPVRTGLISGESGQAVLQRTGRSVCASRGIDPAEANVYWSFTLPHLSKPDHLAALAAAVRRDRVELIIVDPLYLSLLAGSDKQASSLYDMGPLLAQVAQTCFDAGAMPVLVHHSRGSADPVGVPDLGQLAFSGIAEFSRQWLLLGHRSRYEPGSGIFELHLVAGGSAGHSGHWPVDIDVGVLDEGLGGTHWLPSFPDGNRPAAEPAGSARPETRARQELARLLASFDRLDARDGGRRPRSLRAVREGLGLNGTRLAAAVQLGIGGGYFRRAGHGPHAPLIRTDPGQTDTDNGTTGQRDNGTGQRDNGCPAERDNGTAP